MKDKNSLLKTSPQLEHHEQQTLALALSPKQVHALYRKSKEADIPLPILEEVYRRGYTQALTNKEEAGFGRVNSFIHRGTAYQLDADLIEQTTGEPVTTDPELPSSRFVGTPELTNIYKEHTPQQSRADIIKAVVREKMKKESK